jgi:ribose transport system ATP-binding protein
MAPEERKSQALVLDEPVYRNITLATFGRFARGRVHLGRPGTRGRRPGSRPG